MPVFYLSVFGILSMIGNCAFSVNVGIIGKTILFSVIAPLMAFIPLNSNGYVSDGYRILSFITTNHIAPFRVLQGVIYTIKTMLQITFIRNGIRG